MSGKGIVLINNETENKQQIKRSQTKKQRIHTVPRLLASLYLFLLVCINLVGFPGGSDGKIYARSAGDLGLIPSGKSPGEGNGSPLQYSCLENSIDRRAWWAAVRGVAKG